LNIRVVDQALLQLIYTRMDLLGFGSIKEGIALEGYGAMRNLGLIVAAASGAPACIFIDDDEVVTSPDFLEEAMYGMGKLTKKGIPVLVKTGFFTDRAGNWKSKQKPAWYNRFWPQGELFNKWIDGAMQGARLSQSNGLYGGLCAIHREAFRRVSFDPWIPRGEDLDYLLNLRMYGGGVWFDNQWSVIHLPPKTRDESQRFRQDIYRWIYEHNKLEFAKSQIDLLPIQPRSLDPYPGPFLEHSVGRRVFLTALLRTIGRSSYRHGYFRAALAARREARAYAEIYCPRYYEFQAGWPQLIATFEVDRTICDIITGARDHAWETGTMPVVGDEVS
jgi:GT2 family glycosyltransferase